MLYVFDRAKNFVCSFALDKKRIFITDAIIDQAANGAYTLEFSMPADNDNAKEVEELYYVAVPHSNNMDYDLFLVTEIYATHAGGKEIHFFCEHAIKELGDTHKETIFIDRKTAAQALPDIVAGTGWTIGNIEATTEQHSLENRRTNSLALLQQFAETWGGILSYRVVIQGNTITSQLIDYSLETTFSGKRFVYDKDLEEIERNMDASGVKTALYGYGKETARDANDNPVLLDFASIAWTTPTNPAAKPAGQTYIGDAEALAKYGRNGAHLFGEFFYDTEDPAELLQKTWDALQVAKVPKINYKAKVIDLYRLYGWGFEMITAGKIAHVIDNDLDIEAAARIMRYKRDLINREASEIELGAFLEVLSDNMGKLRVEIDNVKQIIPAPIDTSPFVTADPPQTSTRYTEAMRKLQDALFIAGGTVTFTETEGIMITDLPLDQSPTRALRLKGGIFSLGVWDTALNSWNWRSFGDANGFTADEITAGTMSFDRARGGTVTLGGALIGTTGTGAALYENGILEVYDSEGNKIVTLDGQQGGFNRLFVGELSGNNVVLKTIAAVTYYVDHVAGNDDNDGLTTATAYKSIQTALNKLPKFLEHDITIQVQGTSRTYSEPNLLITGFHGTNTKLHLILGELNTLKGEIEITGNTVQVNISTIAGSLSDKTRKATVLNQNRQGWLGVVLFTKNVYCEMWDIIINANNINNFNFQNKWGGHVKLTDVEVYNAKTTGISCEQGSSTDLWTVKGLAPTYGVEVYGGARIAGGNTAPKGNTANVKQSFGGFYNGVYTVFDAGSAKPTYAPSTTTIWTPNDTHSWTSNTGWSSDYVYNGKRPGDPPWWYGFIFFNLRDFSALKNADGTNRPITRVRLFVQRTNNTGENTSRKPQLFCSTQAAASGNGSYYGSGSRSDIGFTWGQSGWITLPTSFGQEFQKGTAKSLCMYDAGSEANYSRFEPTGIQLEITHG